MKKTYLAIFSIIFCILVVTSTVYYSTSIIRGSEETIDDTIFQLESTKLYWNGSSFIGHFELWSNPSNSFVYEVRIRNEIVWSGEEEVYSFTTLILPLEGISMADIGITVNGELISDQGTHYFSEVIGNE